MEEAMHLSPQELLCLKSLVLGQCADWAAFHSKLKVKNMTISQSSLDRFFSGKSKSARTLRKLAISIGTTPEALVSEVRMHTQARRPVASGDSASVKPLRDPDAFRIAFQLWVEMTTRKLGLPIDPAQDLITECYDSWYAFFKSARELIKAIPLHKDPGSDELRRLVQLSQAVLNDGLRPHLQRWQAKFRRWSTTAASTQDPALAPQEAQQRFPEWVALRDDLLATNQRLISYVGALETMIARPNAPRARPAALKPKRGATKNRRGVSGKLTAQPT
jgi:hypothetical protein